MQKGQRSLRASALNAGTATLFAVSPLKGLLACSDPETGPALSTSNRFLTMNLSTISKVPDITNRTAILTINSSR